MALSPRSLLPPSLSPVHPSLRPALPARPSRRQQRAAAPPPWPPGSMAAAVETRRVCETAGCSSEAKLQCPTCLKLGIQGSYFCSQVRFPAARPLAGRSGRAAGAGSAPRAGCRPLGPGPGCPALPPALPAPASCPPLPPSLPAPPGRHPAPGSPRLLLGGGPEPHFPSWPRAMRDRSGTKARGAARLFLRPEVCVLPVLPSKIKAWWDKVRACSSNSGG